MNSDGNGANPTQNARAFNWGKLIERSTNHLPLFPELEGFGRMGQRAVSNLPGAKPVGGCSALFVVIATLNIILIAEQECYCALSLRRLC